MRSGDNGSDQTGPCVGQWIVLAANFARSPIVLNIFWLIWYCGGILRDTGQYLCYRLTHDHDECGPALDDGNVCVHTKPRVVIHLGQLGICIFNCPECNSELVSLPPMSQCKCRTAQLLLEWLIITDSGSWCCLMRSFVLTIRRVIVTTIVMSGLTKHGP